MCSCPPEVSEEKTHAALENEEENFADIKDRSLSNPDVTILFNDGCNKTFLNVFSINRIKSKISSIAVVNDVALLGIMYLYNPATYNTSSFSSFPKLINDVAFDNFFTLTLFFLFSFVSCSASL